MKSKAIIFVYWQQCQRPDDPGGVTIVFRIFIYQRTKISDIETCEKESKGRGKTIRFVYRGYWEHKFFLPYYEIQVSLFSRVWTLFQYFNRFFFTYLESMHYSLHQCSTEHMWCQQKQRVTDRPTYRLTKRSLCGTLLRWYNKNNSYAWH